MTKAALLSAGVAIAPFAFADVFSMGVGVTSLTLVDVGYAGNAPDATYAATLPGLGSVHKPYRMGAHEVTNAQYARFLNAVDPLGTNEYELYNPDMGVGFGGIFFDPSDAPGQKYRARNSRGNQAVLYVSFYDAARFANWLHNGQGSGDTETGAYTFLGVNEIAGGRNPGAEFFVPNENEWYKAAYYHPFDQGGDTDDYWHFATRSNELGPNEFLTSANYYDGDYVGTGNPSFPVQSPLVEVGRYTLGRSFFGTFDQTGSLFEWTETNENGQYVGRGGGWALDETFAGADYRGLSDPTGENTLAGFRIASIPAPGALGVFGVAAVVSGVHRRRNR